MEVDRPHTVRVWGSSTDLYRDLYRGRAYQPLLTGLNGCNWCQRQFDGSWCKLVTDLPLLPTAAYRCQSSEPFDTVEVRSSSLLVPTISFKSVGDKPRISTHNPSHLFHRHSQGFHDLARELIGDKLCDVSICSNPICV